VLLIKLSTNPKIVKRKIRKKEIKNQRKNSYFLKDRNLPNKKAPCKKGAFAATELSLNTKY